MRYITIITGLVLTLSATFLVGCGAKLPSIKPYKMEIQQGNVVTSKMLLQLRPGMTKSQVRFIMGTPLIVDSFHDNRWDYFYQLRQGGKVTEKRRVILDFDKDALVSVRGDVVAAEDKTAEAPINTAPKSVTPPKKEESKSWFDKLKFWGGDEEKTAELPVAATTAAAVAVKETTSTTESAGVASAAPVSDSVTQADSATTEATESILKKAVELPAPKEEVSAATSAAVPSAAITATPDEPVAEKAIEVDQAEIVQKTEVAVAVAPVAEVPAEKVVEQVSSDEASKQAVMATFNTWADAWRNKDFNQYINAYTSNFRPDGLTSHKAWVAQRKARVAKRKDDIGLALEDVTAQVSGSKATVQFFQKYSSNVYTDEVTKQLDFEFDPKTNRWLIVKEFVVAEGRRPSAHKIIAPDGTDDHLEGVIEKIGF